MSKSRLATALLEGLDQGGDGPGAAFRPELDYDISVLEGRDVAIVHGFRPYMNAWTEQGMAVADTCHEVALAIVAVPKSKSLARALIADAMKKAELVFVDGSKDHGIDSLFKECRKRVGDIASVTKAHGRLFVMEGSRRFDDWASRGPVQGPEGFYTQAGVFSETAVDRGSVLLAKALPEKLPARIADLGAGWGYLSHQILQHEGVQNLDLWEAEQLSLECAKLNITDPRAVFHWADAPRDLPKRSYDAVVMNPPFHAGKRADVALGQGFIAAASQSLVAGGHLWMVANRHLPYEAVLAETFAKVEELAGDSGFKVLHAHRPKGGRA